ncbi:MAG: hypothetical protein WBO93_03170 [Gammaproteobacteria bacterium]
MINSLLLMILDPRAKHAYKSLFYKSSLDNYPDRWGYKPPDDRIVAPA